jgi:hypothetical protein
LAESATRLKQVNTLTDRKFLLVSPKCFDFKAITITFGHQNLTPYEIFQALPFHRGCRFFVEFFKKSQQK